MMMMRNVTRLCEIKPNLQLTNPLTMPIMAKIFRRKCSLTTKASLMTLSIPSPSVSLFRLLHTRTNVNGPVKRQSCKNCRLYSTGTSAAMESGSISSVLSEVTGKFEEADISESDILAKFIVGHALNINQLSDFERIEHDRVLSSEEMEAVSKLVGEKMRRVPLQYILGEWDFRGLTLKMKPPVFIPRPETEMLIDLLISHYGEDEPLKVLEVGCGSGAISLSILQEFTNVQVTSIDASAEAVSLTQENAERLGLFQQVNIQHIALQEESIPDVGSGYDVIISNPPYVFTKDMDDLDPEISRYEDSGALEGGLDGLTVIKAIIHHARHLLRPGGFVWLETDIRHGSLIQEWLQRHPETSIQFRGSFLDFNDRPRFCQLEHVP